MPRTKPTRIRRSGKLAKGHQARPPVVPARLRAGEVRRLVEELDAQKEQLQAQNEQLRAAQRELEVSRSRYAELYDSAPVGYVCLDRKGLMLELNLTTARMLGAERFRLVGHPFQLYLAKPDVKKFLGHLSHGKRSGKPVRAELLLAARCGPPRWVQAVTLAVADPEHLKTVFHTSLMDVTERKRAEQALLGSEEQYRLLFERNPHPMWISDRATLGVMAVNDTAIRNYGYTRQEFLAMTLKDLRASRGGAGRWPDHEEGPAGGRGALPGFVGLWMHRRKDAMSPRAGGPKRRFGKAKRGFERPSRTRRRGCARRTPTGGFSRSTRCSVGSWDSPSRSC